MDFDKYKNTMPYPRKEDFTKRYYYKKGELVFTAIPNPGFAPPNGLLDGCVIEKDFDENAYKMAKDIWNNHERELHEQFKKDLFEDLGIADNPKREKLYAIAYVNGHSGGLSEVYNEALDLVDLIL